MALARLRGLDLASGCHLEPLLAARLGLHLGHFRILCRSVERATRHTTLAGRAQTGAPYTPRPAVSQGGCPYFSGKIPAHDLYERVGHVMDRISAGLGRDGP